MNNKTKKKFNSQNQGLIEIYKKSMDIEDFNEEIIKALEKNNHKMDNISLKDCIKKLCHLSNLKIHEKYNCTPKKFNIIIIEYLLNNADCHLVSVFKEKMLSDYIDEFLRREYNIIECKDRLPRFSWYYRNYLRFFCKPTYNHFLYNDLIQKCAQKKAELYYKNNYKGGLSNDNENNGFEESSSDESSDRDDEYDFKNNNNGEIFNNIIKDKIENPTVMTTINSNGNNTINLNIRNEKIEIFSENKAEVSNDTTINDLMEDVKKESKKLKNRKKIDFKNRLKNTYKKILNYSLKNQGNNGNHKALSIDQKKKNSSKHYSKKNNKKRNSYKDKIIKNEKIVNQKLKSQLLKYKIESNRITRNKIKKMTHNKMQKILKKRYSKNGCYNNSNNNNYNYNKESQIFLRNASSSIKSPDYKNNNKHIILGLSGKTIKNRSRNYCSPLYKNITVGTNSTTNKNTNINFEKTLMNKNRISNLTLFESNALTTLNLTNTANHQRTNSHLVKKQNNKKDKHNFQVRNNIPERKTSSLKMLVTDSDNQTILKPAIRIKRNEKFKNKNLKVNTIKNKNIINYNERNFNNKITVTTNNNLKRNSKFNMKKTLVDSNDSITVNSQNYSNFANQMNAKKILYNNEESEKLNKKTIINNYQSKSNCNIMQIALSLYIENSSPTKYNNLHSKNNIMYNSNTNLNNKKHFINNKIVNQKNNYNNINTAAHYNINIHNQININFNNRSRKTIHKSKNKINNRNIGYQKKKYLSKNKNTIINNSNNKFMNSPNVNNYRIRIKTRNYNDSLKGGFTQNYNDKVIKGYHTKSVSNIIDLINHNKKLISLYKSKSISKSKDKEKI